MNAKSHYMFKLNSLIDFALQLLTCISAILNFAAHMSLYVQYLSDGLTVLLLFRHLTANAQKLCIIQEWE